MAITRLTVPTGITPPKVINIPDQWSATWFRSFIKIWMQNQGLGASLGANPTAKVGLSAVNGSATTLIRSDGAPALDVSIAPTWTGDHTFAPASGIGVTINAAAGSFGQQINGSASSGQSDGLLIVAGTSNADNALLISNHLNTLNYFQVRGDGAIFGRGTNANTLVDMSPDTGNFNGALTGLSTSPSVSCSWSKMGKHVMLSIATGGPISGTSNSTAFGMSGLPAEITPSSSISILALPYLTDSGVATAGAVQVLASGNLTFFKGTSVSGASWTASGTKGLGNAMTICYPLI